MALNFLQAFVYIVMKCITTTQYFLMLDGSPQNLIAAKWGVRQGDPISPLTFVFGMEYLSRILNMVGTTKEFKYHPRCKAIKLNHLCFADDLMLLCKGDLPSMQVLQHDLNNFSESSGLSPNSTKSALYLVGIPDMVKIQMTRGLNFPLSSIPFK